MANLPATIRAALNGETVRAVPLVFMDYASGPVRVWAGFGDLATGGHTWLGLGDLGSISDIEQPINGTAPQVTMTLSGVKPEWLPRVRNAQSEVKGRPCIAYFQHFDDDWQVLDGPLAIWFGLMDTISIEAPDAVTRRVELTLEWVFSRRGIAPSAYYTDEDQRALYPGDRGLEFVSAMQNKSVNWPQG